MHISSTAALPRARYAVVSLLVRHNPSRVIASGDGQSATLGTRADIQLINLKFQTLGALFEYADVAAGLLPGCDAFRVQLDTPPYWSPWHPISELADRTVVGIK